MTALTRDFLTHHQGKLIRIFFSSGFQMRGRLVKYDDEVLLISTGEYGPGPGEAPEKEVLVRQDVISTYVPGGSDEANCRFR